MTAAMITCQSAVKACQMDCKLHSVVLSSSSAGVIFSYACAANTHAKSAHSGNFDESLAITAGLA